MLDIKECLPHCCNALILYMDHDGIIEGHLEATFISDASIYTDKHYTTDQSKYLNPLNILGFEDCEVIQDGGIIQIDWEGHTFAVMNEKTYRMYRVRV